MKSSVFLSQIYLESNDKFTINLTTNRSFQMGISSVPFQQSSIKIGSWSEIVESNSLRFF